MSDLHKLQSTYDYEQLARAKLTNNDYDYYASGACDEITLKRNITDYQQIELIPRVLVDITTVDTSLKLFGTPVNFPILVSPMAVQRLAHPDGEIAVTKAAAECGSIMCLSSISSEKIEDVSQAMKSGMKEGKGGIWFQLYILKRRDVTLNLVRRAEQAGYSALVLTVDAATDGKREANFRNRFSYPQGVFPANFKELYDHEIKRTPFENTNQFMISLYDPSITWNDLTWLKSITNLPIIIKGILSPKDAKLAVECGVSGIVVSNHGGRQLDTVPSTISVLPKIVEAVKGSGVQVMIDGGIRRGTDVLKALALGATCVMVGRPVLWGLSASGQRGVAAVLKILQDEFVKAMKLCGITQLSEITKDALGSCTSAKL